MLKLIEQGIGREECVADEGNEFEEGTELDGPVMAGALGVFAGTQAEVKSQDNQVGNVLGLLIIG